MTEMHALPEHVQRIIRRDDEIDFTPPSFERWLGRLQMLRTLSAMGGFSLVWLVTYAGGMGWEAATIRGMIAAIAFHFIAWALGLFIFGELYDIEVKRARIDLEERERDRARRIEEYYRERLRAQGLLSEDVETMPGGSQSHDATQTMSPPTPLTQPGARPGEQRAA